MTAKAADNDGALGNQGGLLGTGLFASAPQQLENAKRRLTKVEDKVRRKAERLLNAPVSSLEKARELLGNDSVNNMLSEAEAEPSGNGKKGGLWWLLVAAVAGKVLKLY